MSQVLKLSNIPIYNLLNDFFRWNTEIRSDEFKRQFAIGRREPIRTHLLIWGGMPDDLLTLILQRAVLGLESYVIAAVYIELGKSGRLTPELVSIVRNPFSIRPREKGAAACYYNALPSLIDPRHSLQNSNSSLWLEVRGFYKDVRNKIMHGNQIGSRDPVVLYEPFDMIRKTYEWVDTFHTLEVRDGRPLRMKITFQKSSSNV
jgi:hypothetical protein